MTWVDEDGTIHHVRGDSFLLTLEDIKEDGVLISSWSGWAVAIQIRDTEDKIKVEFAESDIDKSVPGKLIITKSAAFFDLPVKGYRFGMRMTRPNQQIDTWLPYQTFVIEKNAVREIA